MSEKKIAYDLVKIENSKDYVLVEVEYDPDTKEAKVVNTSVIADNSNSALFKLNKLVVNKLFKIKE